MMIKGSKKKFWFVVVTLCLIVALVVTGVMVLYTPSVQSVLKNTAAQTDVILSRGEEAKSGEDLHTIQSGRLETVCEDGLVTLQIDPVSMAPVILETSEQYTWYSLPLSGSEGGTQGAVLTMEVSAKGGKRYILNSQDNSVAMGNAAITVNSSEKRVSVHYIIALTGEDAQKEKNRLAEKSGGTSSVSEDKQDYMAFSLTVHYTLKDGSFFAEVDCSELQNRPSVRLLSLSLLPGFGSTGGEVNDGFLLVPDGSGAVIDLSKKADKFTSRSFEIYGGDQGTASKPDAAKGSQAVLPAFGVCQKKNAFLAMVEQGDALSTIWAERATGGGDKENTVYASFTLTPHSRALQKGTGTEADQYTEYLGEQPYQGKLSICYRFLTQSNATYSGMAVSCREQLIRNGTLLSSSVSDADYLPFHLSVIGETPVRNKAAGISYNDRQVLTTFDQAEDMVRQMRVKGINNINLRYINMLEGEGSLTAGLNTSLGGRKKLRALAEYMKSEKLDFYMDVNLFALPDSPLSRRSSAYGLDAAPLSKTASITLEGKAGVAVSRYYLRRMNSLDQAVEGFLTRSSAWPVTGLCLNDAGSTLYTDMSKTGSAILEAKQIVSMQTAPLSVNRKLMVDTGNIYMLRGADSVINMPVDAAYATKDGSYRSVPFLQMVVHGMLDYAGPPINEAEDYKTAMLRAVEYGACPSFLWTYGDTSLLSKENHTYYADWLVRATDYYIKANDALYDLRASRITNHYEAASNVFCTVYDNKYRVYVNYNGEEVQVDGLIIPAQDFLKI